MTKTPDLSPLPLDQAWPELDEALRSHLNLVLVAEPGAGKTTRFPPRLLQSGLIENGRKVLVLEPRRLAARASAQRIASEQGWNLGGEVGYQVRFENKTSKATRLQFLTEGLLAKRLQHDSELSDVGAVILDEFHERSQHTDLALGLLFELQQLARPDLRIIVMSATLDADRVAKYLGDAPVVRVPGRTFPVDIQHAAKPLALDTGFAFLDRVSDLLVNIIDGVHPSHGDLLVFLPGAREIRGVRERVANRAAQRNFDCLELHGSLPLAEQDRAIRKSEGRRKIVLSTNIAETSLTIDGVGTVVDAGLARVSRVDALGFTRLQLSRISLASATQRAGRAGRQSAGLCYRLWSKFDEASMQDYEVPEILRTDLTDPLMALLSQGVLDPFQFSWFESPPAAALKFAQKTLDELNFRNEKTGALTTQGEDALRLPLSARLARLVLEAVRAGQPTLGARLAALLSERDIVTRLSDLKAQANIESDLLLRLHLLEGSGSGPTDRIAIQNTRRVADAIEASASRLRPQAEPRRELLKLDKDDLALRLCLLAFPDRVCKRRKAKELAAKMVGGKGVWLSRFSALETEELFVALDSAEPPPNFAGAAATGARSDAQITVASYVRREWIESFFPNSIGRHAQFVFDNETLSVQKQTAVSFRDLPLEDSHTSRPTPDEAFTALVEAARNLWNVHFTKVEALGSVLTRLTFLRAKMADDAALDYDSNHVRTAFLEEACFNETRLGDVLKKPLQEIYLRHLPSVVSRVLHDQVPEKIRVPSGSFIPVQYPDERDPYLEVRIQEIFGLTSTPKICGGRVAIVMHLLGPNFRPVQVTSDLASFWRTGYTEVRKELRLRYPKHSWPEDPTHATPEAKGRRRS